MARARRIRGGHEHPEENDQNHLAGVRRLDALKDEFVGLVSQELRTPLTSVRGYIDLVLDGSAGELTPDQTRYLGVAARSCDRLQRLVDELLLIAHAGAGRLSLEWTRLGLTELVRDVLDALRPAAEERGVELVFVSHGPSVVVADGVRLGQLVETLAAGALVQTPPGGRVEVRARADDTQRGASKSRRPAASSRFPAAASRSPSPARSRRRTAARSSSRATAAARPSRSSSPPHLHVPDTGQEAA